MGRLVLLEARPRPAGEPQVGDDSAALTDTGAVGEFVVPTDPVTVTDTAVTLEGDAAVTESLAVTDTAAVADSGNAVGDLLSLRWTTATGATENAVTDGAKVTTVGGDYGVGDPTKLEVFGPTGLTGDSWTGDGNVLGLYMRGSGPEVDPDLMLAKTLANDADYWGRIYIMFQTGVTHQRNMHPFCAPFGGSILIVYLTWGSIGAAPYIAVGSSEDYAIGVENTSLDTVTRGTWYRFEWKIEHVDATHYKIHARLYNMAGTLLYSSVSGDSPTIGNFINTGLLSETLTEQNAGFGGHPYNSTARQVAFGQPGPAGTTNTGDLVYFAAMDLSSTDWVGA